MGLIHWDVVDRSVNSVRRLRGSKAESCNTGPRVRGAEYIAEFKMGSIVVQVEMLVCIKCKHVLSDSVRCSVVPR